jgi:two-component system CheB/CheR fusion protein
MLIAGVGASAGGLEAFSELLKALPTDTGMGFVLIQHVDPRDQSILEELLANRTSMPVKQAENKFPIEPNHIYLIPPNTSMVIADGILELSPRSTSLDPHHPIDTFLISLAEEMGPNAIGVILSGTASDGTQGLKAIKAGGGITFCQDLVSAKFDSMPQHAIAAGVADFVLSPAAIAEKLARIARHPYSGDNEIAAQKQDGPWLERVFNLLGGKTAVDFTQYKRSTIERRLLRRMVLRKIDDLQTYLAVLEQEPRELEDLFGDLLINVTEFFRDPDVFETLNGTAFPSILQDRKSGEIIRIWVPGCSSGEEVYSIAISLVEFLRDRRLDFPIKLFGTDVSDRTIDRARAGVYTEDSVRVVSAERLKRFFVHSDGAYQISRIIRESCIFSRHNIAKDPPLSRMDLISCRNLLIYLTGPTQKRVVATLGYALQPRGCLLLGPSETLGSMAEYFEVMDSKHKVFRIKPNLKKSVFELQFEVTEIYSPRLTPPAEGTRRTQDREEAYNAQRLLDHLILTRFGPSALLVNQDLNVIEIRGDLTRFLVRSEGEGNPDLLAVVRPDIGQHLGKAIAAAREEETTVRVDSIVVNDQGRANSVNVTVVPIRLHAGKQYFAILFEDVAPAPSLEIAPLPRVQVLDPQAHIVHLEEELRSSREYLQAINEELRSAVEEAQSTNEELQSTNEELQTSKEELQSSNEELHTTNADMQNRYAELAQLTDDLSNLLGSMNMPVVMLGPDLRIRRFTPMAQSVLHLIPADVGRPISDLQPRINVPDLEGILRQVLDTLISYEQEVRDRDGHWHLLRVRPYRTADNHIEGAVLQLLDLGELKRTLEEARRSRDYAQAIVDTVRDPLVVFDESLIVREVNRSFTSYFRTSRSDLIGQEIGESGRAPFTNPKLAQLVEAVAKTASHIEDVEIEQDVNGLGRRVLTINARSMPWLGERGLVLVALGDITEQKFAAEARYRRLFESSKDGIVIVNSATGEITDVNPFVQQLFGYSREELVGKIFWDAGPLRDLPQNRTALELIREHTVIRFPDVTLSDRQGKPLQVEIVGNIYSEDTHRTIQFNIRDLTERRKFERDLQYTAKLESLGLLARGLAHDFNNLLTTILGRASFIYADLPVGDRNRSGLRDITNAAERAAHLTQQMLAYAGEGRFITKRLSVPELIRDTVPLIQTAIPKAVELSLTLDSYAADVEGDPSQLQQLLMNLVLNGAEAIGDGGSGRVEILTSSIHLTREDLALRYASEQLMPGTYVLIEVTDTGSGMDDATKARIFDPFFTTKSTGRGLGLAAALGIVRSHGGAIRVFSAPGQGSTFRVLLPAFPAEVRSPRSNIIAANVPGQATILLIVDEETVRKIATDSLERAGYEVIVAKNGGDGLDAFRAHHDEIQLVLLDLATPVSAGGETLDRLREIRTDMPVVLVTAFDEFEAVRRLGQYQFATFLQKPYTFAQLLSVVARAITA